MNQMQIGDRVKVRVSDIDAIWRNRRFDKIVEGTVVYIHPEGRFITVRTPSGYCVSYALTRGTTVDENDGLS